MEILHFRTGTWFLRPQSISVHQTCKNTNNKWQYEYKYINVKTYNHSRRWPYKSTAIKYMPPPAATYICAQGRDYSSRYRKPATFPFPLMSTASLRVVGHECHTPLLHNEVLHLYRWYTLKHAPQQRGRWNVNESEMRMKMRCKWTNQDAKRGTQKKRERANTNTNTPGPELANPERAREAKTEADGNGTRPAEEGEDGSAWTNLPQRNLSLPKHAQDPTYL